MNTRDWYDQTGTEGWPQMLELNQTELARQLRVTTRQVRNWEAEGLPCRSDGRSKHYPLGAVIRWYRDREVDRALEGAEPSRIEELRARKLELEVELQEMALAARRRELIPMDESIRLLCESLEKVAAILQAVPRKLAPRLAAKAKISRNAARLLLVEMVEGAKSDLRESVRGAR